MRTMQRRPLTHQEEVDLGWKLVDFMAEEDERERSEKAPLNREADDHPESLPLKNARNMNA